MPYYVSVQASDAAIDHLKAIAAGCGNIAYYWDWEFDGALAPSPDPMESKVI